MNSSFSSLVIPLILVATLVTELRSLSSIPMMDRSSTILLNALLTQGLCFLCGQFCAMCPCSKHSKHHPSCQCFCFSASVVAFRTVSTSIAFGSKGGAQQGFACPLFPLFQGKVFPWFCMLRWGGRLLPTFCFNVWRRSQPR